MAPLRPLPLLTPFLASIAILFSLGMFAGCVGNTSNVTIPRPPAAQDPFAGLPFSKSADEKPLEDVLVAKGRQRPRVGLILSDNTKATQQYAEQYRDALAASKRKDGRTNTLGSVAISPVLEAVQRGFEEDGIQLEKWEEAKKTGVDLVALIDLTCNFPLSSLDSATYSVRMYMLTPDGELLTVIQAEHTEQSGAAEQMMTAQMMGRAIDNSQGGTTKSFNVYEQKFMDAALMQSGSGQTILRAMRAVSRKAEKKVHDFLDEFDEAQAFSKMLKSRR